SRTVFVDVGRDGIRNLAVTNLKLDYPLATSSTPTPILYTIHNYGPETRDQVKVELLTGKARMTAADPKLQMRVAAQTTVKLSRGSNDFSFQYKYSTPGEYVLQIRLENDALDLDDIRSAVVTVKNAVPAMLV